MSDNTDSQSNADYRRLYENQTRVLNETEMLRQSLMVILCKRYERIRALEKMVRQARQLFFILLMAFVAAAFLWGFVVLPYFLEYYNV